MKSPAARRLRWPGAPRHWRKVFGAACAVMLLGGCRNLSETHHPRSHERKVFVAGQNSLVVTVEFGTQLDLVLPGPGPIRGYVWEVVSNNARVLEQQRPPAGIGNTDSTTVSFYALKPGRSLVRFVLMRPDENEAITLARREAVVTVINP
jgi:predicted secreted protein